MRLTTLLVLLAATASAPWTATASAQDADPRPAWTYDPVAVGNVRSYVQAGAPSLETRYSRTDSPTAVTRDGLRWVVRRTQRFTRLDSGGWSRTESRTLVRYDTTAANVLRRLDDGTTEPLYPCRLDLPLSDRAECGDGYFYSKADGELRFSTLVSGQTLRSGLGETGSGLKGNPPVFLVGAVVAGEVIQEEPDDFPNSRVASTPAAPFAPLSDGNEWQYEIRDASSVEYRRLQIIGAREAEGALYAIQAESVAAPGASGWTGLPAERLVRYDTLTARVVEAGQPRDFQIGCPFDEPLSDDGATDPVFCEETLVARSSSAEVVVREDRFETVGRSFPSILFDTGTDQYAAGIGFIGRDGFVSPLASHRLIYARVRQPDGTVLELGQRYAVASDAGPDAGDLSLTVGPNPTSGPVTLRLDVPVGGAVRWTVTDALGRVMWERDDVRAPGTATIAFDLSDAPAGLYVARAATASGAVTATIVRR